MKYVALLRGINVGSNTRVEMTKLKAVFERLGCSNVLTYINSGNVIFEDSRDRKALETLIEKTINKEFGLNIPVVVRDKANISLLANKIPKEWSNQEQRTEVMFLWDEVDNSEVVDNLSINPDIENLIYLPGALVWNIDRQHYKQGSGPRIIRSGFYKKMTGRNINTVRKLEQLMSDS